MPGGAIVDAARSERRVAALAMIAISASALVIALWPIFPSVLAAQILHAAGSSVVSPALAAISLGLVGHAASAERFGRNARFASIGNGLAAARMGDDIGRGRDRGAAARRRSILALGRALGAAMGTPADPARRLRRTAYSRPVAHGRGRPSPAGGGAAARRHQRRGVRRAGSAHD